MHRFASVVLVDRRGWVLLQERDEHPAIDPERWGFVGGHLDPGEDFEPAAYRELEEESGIRMLPGDLLLWGEFEVFHEAYDSRDAVQVWVGATDLGDADVVVGEGRQVVFVDPARVPSLDLTASASQLLPEFLASPCYQDLAR